MIISGLRPSQTHFPLSGNTLLSFLFYQLPEFPEQRRRIMRARRRFWMILHAENRPAPVPHPLHRPVVQIHPVHAHLRRQRIRVHREPVVLRRDFHPARRQVLHRLVRAAMPELQFERFAAERLAQYLVPQADPENRNPALHQITHRPHRITQRGGIARPVGEKNPRRLVRQRFLGRRRRRHHLHLEPMLPQPPHDVVFHPKIVGHNRYVRRRQWFAHLACLGFFRAVSQLEARALLVLFIPQERLLVRHFLHVIHPPQPPPRLRPFQRLALRNPLLTNKPPQPPPHPPLLRQRPPV